MIRLKTLFMINSSLKVSLLAFIVMLGTLSGYPSQLSAQSDSQNLDRIVAVVNDNIILKSDVDRRVAEFLQRSRQQSRGTTPSFSKELWYNALESVIDQYVLLENARMDSVTVSSEQVSNAMQRRIDQMIQQAGSKEKVEQALGKSIAEVKAQFRSQFREDMIVREYRRLKIEDISITRPEVKKFYEDIPRDSIPTIPEQVELSQIVRIPPPLEDAKTNARQLAKQLRDSVLNHGKDFEALARRHSDGPSAQKGGLLPLMPMNELVPAYATAASNLETGEISNVVETSYGYHIIRLNKRVGDKISTNHILISVDKNQVDKQVAIKKLNAIRDSVLNHGKSFAKMAQRYSEDKNTASVGGKILNPQSGGRLIPVNQLDPALQRITYLLEEVGDISEPKSFTPDKQNAKTAYRIVKLDNRIPEHTANLKQDYERIKNMALQEKQIRAMQQWLEKLRDQVYVKYHIDKPSSVDPLQKQIKQQTRNPAVSEEQKQSNTR